MSFLMGSVFTRVVACTLSAFLAVIQGNAAEHSRQDEPGDTAPQLLSFEELVALSSTADPQGALGARLGRLLTTPFVHNFQSSYATQERANLHDASSTSHASLCVVFWNIERGLNLEQIRAAFSGLAEFERVAQVSSGLSVREKRRIADQLSELKRADIIVLNEVDLGMKRTEYRDVTRELATALHMNYAYGVEFVETDPIFELNTENVHLPDAKQDARLHEDLRVDRERYRGLHGNAILSRHPLRNARILRLPVCHDWYRTEVKDITRLEQAKRWSARTLFRERIEREVRHGGRMALIAKINLPELPGGELTVVATHLENKCPPDCRRRQMSALLASLRQEKSPVVLAGDLNTTGRDNTPTSIRNEIMRRVTDYGFWIHQAVSKFHPLGVFQYALLPLHYLHHYGDHTAFHLPIFWENRERGLFKTVESFRFDDGHAFDFRGVADHSVGGRKGTLADSNERAFKGLVPTYWFARDYRGLAGRFKLDWFFVKAFIAQPRGKQQNYFFAPERGVTMRDLNGVVPDRISDHPPLALELPLSVQPGSQ